MHRYQILIEYVGTNFIGWQKQSKGQSIQKLIQIKVSKLLKEQINLVGSGRTDAGVHAVEQSAHFDCKKKIKNLSKFLQSINFFLNIKLISITNIKNKIQIQFKSQSFLQQQVRSMVGCLKYLAEKKWDLKKFENVFKSKKRTLCAPPAPAHGLFLERVIY